MPDLNWLQDATPAFRLAMATSWLAPEPWQRNQEEDIGQAIDSGPDWGEYLSLVNRHQIQAVSWAALSRVQVIPVPDTVKQELESRTRSCRILGVQRSLVLAEVLGEFNRAGIPAMPLKGPVLSFELYGDVGLRASDDVDVQVPAEDLRRAMDCLETRLRFSGDDTATVAEFPAQRLRDAVHPGGLQLGTSLAQSLGDTGCHERQVGEKHCGAVAGTLDPDDERR